jgi:hypothetical protein
VRKSVVSRKTLHKCAAAFRRLVTLLTIDTSHQRGGHTLDSNHYRNFHSTIQPSSSVPCPGISR